MQDYIKQHLEDRVSLKDLAEAAGYAESYASRVFSEIVGIAPLDYLRARRLSRAADKLRGSAAKIIEISLEAGFETHEGFLRAFKKRFGICKQTLASHSNPDSRSPVLAQIVAAEDVSSFYVEIVSLKVGGIVVSAGE